MDAQEKKTRATALRENLRDGRNRSVDETSQAVDGTSQGTGGTFDNSNATPGATIQDARGTASDFTPTGGKPTRSNKRDRDDKRGAAREPERERRADRRDEENHGGAPANPATPERTEPTSQRPTVGRLEASEIINEPGVSKFDLRPDATLPVQGTHYKEDYRRTQREGQNVYALISNPAQFITGDEYKSLRSRAESETSTNSPSSDSANSSKPAFFKGGVLSKEEAEEYYEPLVAAIGDGFGYADRGIWKLCPQLDERPIWSNTMPREDQALARLLLKRGQTSPAAALIVRETVNSGDYVIVGLMFGPRMVETFQALRERPAPDPKKKLTLFRKAQA